MQPENKTTKRLIRDWPMWMRLALVRAPRKRISHMPLAYQLAMVRRIPT